MENLNREPGSCRSPIRLVIFATERVRIRAQLQLISRLRVFDGAVEEGASEVRCTQLRGEFNEGSNRWTRRLRSTYEFSNFAEIA